MEEPGDNQALEEGGQGMDRMQYEGGQALLHLQAAQGGNPSLLAGSGLPGVPTISPGPIVFTKPNVGRREEVQRLLGMALVYKCDPSGPYQAPVIVLAQEENNVYNLIERFVRPEYLNGAERFWKLIRGDLGVETWRPRVQGAQLKALQGARLAETEQELAQLDQVIHSIGDCLKPDVTPALVAAEARAFIRLAQVWWDNRNKRPEGVCTLQWRMHGGRGQATGGAGKGDGMQQAGGVGTSSWLGWRRRLH